MPTESDYLGAADLFREAGGGVGLVPAALVESFGSEVVTGGQLTLEIDSLITQTIGACGLDEGKLIGLAQKCAERAAVVAAYEAAIGDWSNRMREYNWAMDRWLGLEDRYQRNPMQAPLPGPRPSLPLRPVKPYTWID